MWKKSQFLSIFFVYLCISICSFPFHVVLAGKVENSGNDVAGRDPFSAKASLMRYWNRKVSNNNPTPLFLLSKASPLGGVDAVTFTKLIDQNSISSTNLSRFCSTAHLFCFPDSLQSSSKQISDANFANYRSRQFTNYGTSRIGGFDSFQNYSEGVNLPIDSFTRYSRSSNGRNEKFSSYAPDANVIDESFTNYGSGATGGDGDFTNYAQNVNSPNLRFTSYDSDSNGKIQSFTSYSGNTNSGDQKFTSYGKNGNAAPVGFTSYGADSNVIGSTFTGYGERGSSANDSFTSYGFNGNVPQNNFRSYNDNGNGGIDSFSSYREKANVGDDSFQSYAKESTSAKATFSNYGKSFNTGSDTFKLYGREASDQSIGFKIYGVNTTFSDYAKTGITFAKYTNSSTSPSHLGISFNRWVEPGKFFREKMLKQGTVMAMPDITDKMPIRSFLPKLISQKLPFSTSEFNKLTQIFHANENSTMESLMKNTLAECERVPSRGETKRCVTSIEDMIDFAVSVLGPDVAVRTTENINGSKRNVKIGTVEGINDGKITKSVSCHQSLFPYLVYYCHSVPKVRVYKAEILDVKTNEKINTGVAICHLDTSSWSETHGAFMALGSKPGKIEVCHWIFENDMTWAVSDY